VICGETPKKTFFSNPTSRNSDAYNNLEFGIENNFLLLFWNLFEDILGYPGCVAKANQQLVLLGVFRIFRNVRNYQ
jgi:hypothetical protein